MKKSIKITESQYNRIFLNEQSNSPKEYDCIEEKYGDKGSVIQFDTRKSYIIKNNNNDRLYFLEDKSFFHVKKGQGWRTEGQYSCTDKKYKIKNKEGGLFEYIDNFLKSPKRLPEPTSNSVEDEDVDYGGCVKGTYLEGVVKSRIQTPITGLERNDNVTLEKPPKEPSGCRVCYTHTNSGVNTNICFYENQLYFVESTTRNENKKFNPNKALINQFTKDPIENVSYISYLGTWDTDDVFVGDIQKIVLKIGRIKLQYIREDSVYKKVTSVGMVNIGKPNDLFEVLFGVYLINNEYIKPTEKTPLNRVDKNFYNTISNLVKTTFTSTDTDKLVEALEKIKDKFKDWSEFDNFEYDVQLSGQDSMKKLIIDNAKYSGDSDWATKIKPKLQKVLEGKSTWDTLPSVIEDINKHFTKP